MAIRWIARAQFGETSARVSPRQRASRLDAYEAFIEGLIEERRKITLNEAMPRLSNKRSADDILISQACRCRHEAER